MSAPVAASWIADLLPRAGVLDPVELERLARAIAARPERWGDLVRHDPERRTYELLHDDADVTVWLICWGPGHDTGFHDHEHSGAGVAIAEGAVVDERLTAFGGPIARRLADGGSTTIDPAEIHRVHHPGGAPAVTVHAYSPPLDRMGAYEVADDGRLLRHPRSGEADLAPVRED
ncbi:cysteine dioxygenase family protein [Patulibacter brassicae]|uniref:Cysteine dioxygenase family protein n=1 Tax=Patulibacter brassicae TaxID=1705717 RepID=A0ABU4VHP2_9ACTN|nr:cysteine dioxygenase family protein [Patulibacter brassicae]MDX8151332.1 cysteine dioxygenase family protein [Patulibacter brassicae]